jgi:hypothetical protein
MCADLSLCLWMTVSFLRGNELVRGDFISMSYAFRKYSVHTSENNEFGSSAESSAFFPLLGFSPLLCRIYSQKRRAKNSENNPKLSTLSRELFFLTQDQRTGLSYRILWSFSLSHTTFQNYHVLYSSNSSHITQF